MGGMPGQGDDRGREIGQAPPDLHGRQHLGDRGTGGVGALHLDGNQARVSVGHGERDGFQMAVDGRFPPREGARES